MTPEELPQSDCMSDYDWCSLFDATAEYAGKSGYAGPVSAAILKRVIWIKASSPEGYCSREIALLAELNDGWFAMCEAWADTTGWDCRGTVDWKIAPTLEETVNELSSENRRLWRVEEKYRITQLLIAQSSLGYH